MIINRKNVREVYWNIAMSDYLYLNVYTDTFTLSKKAAAILDIEDGDFIEFGYESRYASMFIVKSDNVDGFLVRTPPEDYKQYFRFTSLPLVKLIKRDYRLTEANYSFSLKETTYLGVVALRLGGFKLKSKV